jgi:WD40 repeat-containing protein SMU1
MIEVYDPGTSRLRLDLPYQASDDFMLHEEAVLALAVSRDSELIASGGKDGKLKVWRLRSGDCLRKFASAHGDAAVSAVAFSRDASNVLSGGGDGTARVFGLRSGNCLKEFRGHTSAVTAVAFLDDGLSAVTGSADGSARVWDVRSGECVSTIRPPQESLTGESPIVALFPVPRTTDQLILVPRAGVAYRMSTRGALQCTYTHARKPLPGSRDLHAAGVQISGSKSRDGPPPASTVVRPGVGPAGADFAAACLSPLGRLLYAVTEDGFQYVFDAASGALEASTSSPLHEGGAGVTGLAHAPNEPSLASFAEDGAVKFWR